MKKETVQSVIESHNEYKADIAEAELVSMDEKTLKVKFEGNFCLSCCMDEYFIDLVHELKEEGIETELISFHQIESKTFIAEYEKK